MIDCQSDHADRYLHEQLSQHESAQFESHIETCRVCRERLESIAGEPSDWQHTKEWLGSSSELCKWDQHSAPSDVRQLHSLGLEILSPTDQPESIGRLGNYEIRGVIGRGGMGIVYKAFDQSLNRFVAIKMLDPLMAGVAVARDRFAREARAMAAISHEHLVPIYSVEEQRGVPYFAMEYVAGGTLQSRLQAVGRLEVVSIVRIAYQVAAALAAAHDCGLVHRDIKPANILLDRGIERVRVTDFGLARIASDATYTHSGFVAGTPQYMSPEQVRGEACDWRSDLFSLGSLIYTMCVGHSPFRSESLYGSMQRVVHDTPRSIRVQNPGIPQWLESFVFRLLAKDPSKRFDSTSAVVDMLRLELQYLQSPTEHPKPHRSWLKQTARSRLLRSLALAAILSVSCSLAGVALWKAYDEEPKSSSDQTRSSQSKATTKPPQPDVPTLWSGDADIKAINAKIDQLERSYINDRSGEFDDWRSKVIGIEQHLDRLSKDLNF